MPDAWIDTTKTKVGYEIPLNRRLGLAIAVAADFRSLITFAQGSEHGLKFRSAQAHSLDAVYFAQSGEKFLAILE